MHQQLMPAHTVDPGETCLGELGTKAAGTKPGTPAFQVVGIVDADQVVDTDLLDELTDGVLAVVRILVPCTLLEAAAAMPDAFADVPRAAEGSA